MVEVTTNDIQVATHIFLKVGCAKCQAAHSQPLQLELKDKSIAEAWEAVLALGWVPYKKDFYCAACWSELCHEGS
jgi:hypothetical protein